MQIHGLTEFEQGDSDFKIGDRVIPYNAVQSTHFVATVTQHSINLIPTGKNYDTTLRVLIQDCWTNIEQKMGMIRGLKKDGFKALQQACSILAAVTFTSRVELHEGKVAERNYFEVADYQIHRNGHVFHKGREVGSLRDPQVSLRLDPFQLTLERKPKSKGGRLLSILSTQNVIIPLEVDRDCSLYMMNRVHSIRFKYAPPPEKRRVRRRVFYDAVLRFGALLSKVDGSVDTQEFTQLCLFFGLNEGKSDGAAKVFEKELLAQSSLADVLGDFAEEFEKAREVKEGFLLGMLSVAVADSGFRRSEV